MKHLNYILLFICIYLLQNCAQKATPTGGKKDVIPPLISNTFPKNKTLNFSASEISLVFDEYIKLDNIQQQLIITPKIEGTYKPKVNKKTLVIKFDKPFKENTTYVLNFRNAIKDITESNIAQNIKYVLSTGQQIDSLKVTGNIRIAQTNKPVINATVGLYPLTDTLKILKEIPYYFTKTDSSGNYIIENIKANNYKLAAFLDANNNNIANIQSEKIAFLKDTLKLITNIENANLLLINQDKLPLKIVNNRTTINKGYITLNKKPLIYTVQFDNPNHTIPFKIEEKEITFYKTKTIEDTLKIEINATDSLGKNYTLKQKLLFKKPGKKAENTNEPIAIKKLKNNNLVIGDTFEFIFSKPIEFTDINKIEFKKDSINITKLDTTDITWNISKDKLIIKNKSKYNVSCFINFEQGAFISVEKDSSKTQQFNYEFAQEEETGILNGTVKDFKGTEVLELLNEQYEIIKTIYYKQKYNFKFISPGKYFLRKYYDSNKNGFWDSGDYENDIEPEKIQLFNGKLIIKANFELSGYDF